MAREKVDNYWKRFIVDKQEFINDIVRDYTYQHVENSGMVEFEFDSDYNYEYGKSQSSRVDLAFGDRAVVEEFGGNDHERHTS